MCSSKARGKRKTESIGSNPPDKHMEKVDDLPPGSGNSTQDNDIPQDSSRDDSDSDDDLYLNEPVNRQTTDRLTAMGSPNRSHSYDQSRDSIIHSDKAVEISSSSANVDNPGGNTIDRAVPASDQSSSLHVVSPTISSPNRRKPRTTALSKSIVPDLPPPSMDLVDYIPGMYRILDLVSEQGSGGLVDKIIIAQDSFGSFVNAICPGAYQSMTHVNFSALDQLQLRPVGLYGSKSEIVRYLKDLNLVDDNLARLLLDSQDENTDVSRRTLRSGLYLIRDIPQDVVYVLYWPQDTTWNDDAISSVARNRVTFMRYLTKIADQTVVLISAEHAGGITWEDGSSRDAVDVDDDSDRLFVFHVAKTHEQEENVTTKPGFEIHNSLIKAAVVPDESPISPEVLKPCLVQGDTCSGIMTVKHEPAVLLTKTIDESYSTFRLRQMIEKESFRLADSISEDCLAILWQAGIGSVAGDAFDAFNRRRANMRHVLDNEEQQSLTSLEDTITSQHDLILDAVRTEAIKIVTAKFDALPVEELYGTQQGPNAVIVDHQKASELLASLAMIHPKLNGLLNALRDDHKLRFIESKAFKRRKIQLLKCEAELYEMPSNTPYDRQLQVVNDILQEKEEPYESPGIVARVAGAITQFPAMFTSTSSQKQLNIPMTSNSDFLQRLPSVIGQFPVLAPGANEAVATAVDYFSRYIQTVANQVTRRLEDLKRDECKRQLKAKRDHVWSATVDETRLDFLRAVENSFIRDPEQVTLVSSVRAARSYTSYAQQPSHFRVVGRRQLQSKACLKYSIRLLQLTEADKQGLQMNSAHIPQPRISSTAYTFSLPLDQQVVHCQLLEQDKCLLITSDSKENLAVFLSRLVDIDAAVAANRCQKRLLSEKIGQTPLIAFDESKRMLALCTTEKPTLHIFLFDETLSTLQGYGSPVDLRAWFAESQVVIKHMTFRCGSAEELLIVDEAGRARVYSLATQSFRPAFVQLGTMPFAVTSSPDGSCAFAIEHHTSGLVLQAYHWANFGSSNGICLEFPGSTSDSWSVTSFAKRNSSRCHFVTLDAQNQSLKSVMMEITHKSTEYTFQADGKSKSSSSAPEVMKHTTLLTCHREVWTRFPVVPAVRRQTVKSLHRRARSLTFVSQLPANTFYRQYTIMLNAFENATRKPTGGELASVEIHGLTYEKLLDARIQDVSQFQAGEWLVDILCLIPIHLAVARDNRFVPLKDGVWSLDLERSLLGATVDQVIDRLSFGWYESIFQSYMANKPVKVVSSMGEQSVGKSFALNHLVDTSFAGSAMRTTEGVWMAVTPTEEALIVALDFEGVHSIERTAQEDSLLVLFNTAISNLVLFRNNFALSRDITGLFQSFQSSSTVLDPAANPSLFKSTLVIIIKDVVDSDKTEIRKEFSLKFQRIVEVEQDANFISRLHAGKLAIIPWPVIESRQFYTLFPTVKKMLDMQVTTHPKAGIFLQTMKTLMAKLKTNDWGSIDQNLASHRARQLQNLLPQAFATGAMEIDPVLEPLKDFDSGMPIDMPDSDAKFYVQQANGAAMDSERSKCLALLRSSWSKCEERFDVDDVTDTIWAEELSQYLETQAERRLEHVRAWVDVNTARFKSDATNFAALYRDFENTAVALKTNVRICKMQCASCQLVCLLPRHHEGVHDCQTSHQCPQSCSFVSEHEDTVKTCGMPAGHPGKHICDVALHLCGQPCRLSGRGGCLERCAKVVDHADDEHICQARAHECGMACSLSGIRLPDGSTYSCGELCCISSEEPHTEHTCKQRSCPVKCRLCKRPCADSDHLHGLSPDALHLCGAEHICPALCQADGICKIETAPQSINATFTGRHETFQYTKYTQIAKSLQCAVIIPPGETQHDGRHVHEVGGNAFHFCKAQCEYCGYYCTLPLGHRQPEHETSHGSMSRTQWSIDGPDGTVMEVNGRKFASNDDGAPMLCSMVCRSLGRHAHIDYCRSQDPATCSSADLTHISTRMAPNPARAKDWVSHDLYWRRSGFKDPYSQDDRTEFSKCDAMCGGPEHQPDPNGPAQPSFCNLPIFHPPRAIADGPPGGAGYISGDGHHFLCRNPMQLQQAFHVMFVIDRSGSMGGIDRRPLENTPVTARLRARHNNRVGAVYSSLYGFWHARHSILSGGATRRDAYSVILFDHSLHTALSNDFGSTPDALLDKVMPYGAGGGTNFDLALKETQRCMQSNHSTERAPVVIFLSDGECGVTDAVVRDLCRQAITLGKPLSFHAVSFGPANQYLRRITQIATEVQATVPADPMHPVVACSYTEALDTIRLAETFLGIAQSLTKPRGALMHN